MHALVSKIYDVVCIVMLDCCELVLCNCVANTINAYLLLMAYSTSVCAALGWRVLAAWDSVI